MTNCLICGRAIARRLSLRELLLPGPILEPILCRSCQNSFPRINHEGACPGCGREGHHGNLCSECQQWKEQLGWVVQNHPMYHYHGAISEFMINYKFHGDYRLRKALNTEFVNFIDNVVVTESVQVMVPIPVSEHTMATRGFNQVLGLLDELNPSIPLKMLLQTRNKKKQAQSTKDRAGRLATAQPFKFSSKINLQGKTVLIVDDVYTTGRTMYHAASLLKQAGARQIIGACLAA